MLHDLHDSSFSVLAEGWITWNWGLAIRYSMTMIRGGSAHPLVPMHDGLNLPVTAIAGDRASQQNPGQGQAAAESSAPGWHISQGKGGAHNKAIEIEPPATVRVRHVHLSQVTCAHASGHC